MKKMIALASLGLLLSACGGDKVGAGKAFSSFSGTVVEAVKPTGDALTSYTLTTKAWTGGAGTVLGRFSDSSAPSKLGDLSAAGNFTATLPTPSAADLRKFDTSAVEFGDFSSIFSGVSLTCTGTPTVSDANAQTASMAVEVDASKDGSIMPISASATSAVDKNTGTGDFKASLGFGFLVYSDRATSIKGTQNCQSADGNHKYTSTVNVLSTRHFTEITSGRG